MICTAAVAADPLGVAMKMHRWMFGSLVLLMVALYGCSDDTAGGVAGTPTPDTGGEEDASGMVDMGSEDTSTGGASCTTNGECTPPDVCVFDLTTGEGTCGPGTGGQTGDMCSTGADCASGLCINGLCADPCGGEADCPAGYECAATEIPLTGGGSVTLNVCVPEPQGCARAADCAGTDVCVVDRTGAQIDLACDAPVGGGAVGTACRLDGDCEANLCLDGACTAPCTAAADCATDGSMVCESRPVGTAGTDQDLNVCVPRPPQQCLSDSDCTAPERCVASRTATDVLFECGDPNAGGGESGDTCLVDGDCAQNLCLNGTCAGPCETAGDCGGGDFTCEVTNVDLGGGNSDSAQVCAPPTLCADPSACGGTDVCFVREATTEFELLCRDPNVGGGSLGQVCGTARECANNFCLDTRFRDVCATPCDDNGDCAVAGYACQTVSADLTAGGTDDLSLCVPQAPTPCQTQSDCATGLDCVIIEDEAGTALESVCVPTTGGDATGVGCTADEDCASLVCLNGFCAGPCTDSIQCGVGQLCQVNTIDKNGTTGDFNVCETLPEQQCTSSDDCSDGVRVCSNVRDVAGTDTAYCRFPLTGQAALGSACTGAAQCFDAICLSISEECSVVCDKDGDCAAGQGCTTFGDLNYCIGACTDDTDCASEGNICTIQGDVITDDVDQHCSRPIGTLDLGETCAGGGECISGLCLRTLQYRAGSTCTIDNDCLFGETCECPINQPNCTTGKECAAVEPRCTRICDDNTDCVGGATNALTSCSPSTVVQRPSGTTKQISTCAQP